MQTFQIDFGSGKPSKVVGIDLGTTNSLVAWMDAAAPKVIPNPEGGSIVPSVVSYTEAGEFVVGQAAREMLVTDPARTAYSVKRLLGLGIADVKEEIGLFPFAIGEGSESVIQIQLGDRELTAREVSACILRQLKKNAEAHLGETVSQAV
ncbi:MAG: Hsp70 family protein, partial [bacterium]|nr:Hsp70 family protein [bacterium]